MLNLQSTPISVYSSTKKNASEKLEQLRYLEYGKRIKMVETSHSSIGIDTPEDLEKARKLLS
jgi:3-deoxy-manno-octulosonate cytidylyltransferase (CMP-KDO synthetase)